MILFTGDVQPAMTLCQASKLQYLNHGRKGEWALRSSSAVSAVGTEFWRFREGLPEAVGIEIWKRNSLEEGKGKEVQACRPTQ